VEVNDATDSNGQSIPGAHVVDTSFDITWPGTNSFGAALEGAAVSQDASSHSLCASVFEANFPQSTADRYDPERQGNCEPVFGSACFSAMMDAVTSDGSGCPSAGDILLLDQCQQAFGSGTSQISTGREYNVLRFLKSVLMIV
jgi:hypothetical protein